MKRILLLLMFLLTTTAGFAQTECKSVDVWQMLQQHFVGEWEIKPKSSDKYTLKVLGNEKGLVLFAIYGFRYGEYFFEEDQLYFAVNPGENPNSYRPENIVSCSSLSYTSGGSKLLSMSSDEVLTKTEFYRLRKNQATRIKIYKIVDGKEKLSATAKRIK